MSVAAINHPASSYGHPWSAAIGGHLAACGRGTVHSPAGDQRQAPSQESSQESPPSIHHRGSVVTTEFFRPVHLECLTRNATRGGVSRHDGARPRAGRISVSVVGMMRLRAARATQTFPRSPGTAGDHSRKVLRAVRTAQRRDVCFPRPEKLARRRIATRSDCVPCVCVGTAPRRGTCGRRSLWEVCGRPKRVARWCALAPPARGLQTQHRTWLRV